MKLKPVPLHDPLAREAAVFAIRLILEQRAESRILRHGDVYEQRALSVTGLDPVGHGTITLAELRAALAAQLQRAQRMLGRRRRDRLAENIGMLGDALGLAVAEQQLLRFLVIRSRVDGFTDLIEMMRWQSRGDTLRALTRLLGQRMDKVRSALRTGGGLERAGLLDGGTAHPGYAVPEVDSAVCEQLLSRKLDLERFLRSMARPSPPPRIKASDLTTHAAHFEWLCRYVREAQRRGRVGANVLIHGPPGTGKTQLVRLVAQHCGLSLYEVPIDDRDGDALRGRARINAYSVCQRLLEQRRGAMVLFDEIEDAFPARHALSQLFGHDSSSGSEKAWVNEILEGNPVPAFWLANQVEQMDPAFMRRFDIVMEMGAMSTGQRGRMVERFLGHLPVSRSLQARLAEQRGIEAGHLERMGQVVDTLGEREPERVDASVEWLLDGYVRATGGRARLRHTPLPAHYRPDLLNASQDLAAIADGLERFGRGRLCFYGPPGTGKTGFAQHLAARLDRPLLVRRGSDLLSMWVGGTEAAIAGAFDEAVRDGAILVIDEVDGFLRGRDGARASWEVTQVNEMLTQMESFDGIFIASTNLMDSLDPAAMRRFDHKIHFKPLRADQAWALLEEVLSRAGASVPANEAGLLKMRLARLTQVTPGDFAAVARALELEDRLADPAAWVEALEAECRLKPGSGSGRIGFLA
ncbi:MAG TPA: ATP-binding protein [Xanthomonadaceae bacterium]|nr:ATP-binding protein [Xanthomonadaceae bacterium]